MWFIFGQMRYSLRDMNLTEHSPWTNSCLAGQHIPYVLYESWRFITVLASCYWTLSWTIWVQFTA
jgi:hypothetical protein